MAAEVAIIRQCVVMSMSAVEVLGIPGGTPAKVRGFPHMAWGWPEKTPRAASNVPGVSNALFVTSRGNSKSPDFFSQPHQEALPQIYL